MRPVPIPDELIEKGYERQVFIGDSDLEVIYPCEGMMGAEPNGSPQTAFLVLIEPEDIEHIQEGRNLFWLVIKSHRIYPYGFSEVFHSEEVKSGS